MRARARARIRLRVSESASRAGAVTSSAAAAASAVELDAPHVQLYSLPQPRLYCATCVSMHALHSTGC